LLQFHCSFFVRRNPTNHTVSQPPEENSIALRMIVARFFFFFFFQSPPTVAIFPPLISPLHYIRNRIRFHECLSSKCTRLDLAISVILNFHSSSLHHQVQVAHLHTYWRHSSAPHHDAIRSQHVTTGNLDIILSSTLPSIVADEVRVSSISFQCTKLTWSRIQRTITVILLIIHHMLPNRTGIEVATNFIPVFQHLA